MGNLGNFLYRFFLFIGVPSFVPLFRMVRIPIESGQAGKFNEPPPFTGGLRGVDGGNPLATYLIIQGAQ